MRPREIHNPAAQSRARIFHFLRADRRLTGSDYSPLLDAFHPSFPASIEDYISQPCGSSMENPTPGRPSHDNHCLDAFPCPRNRFEHNAGRQVNGAVTNGSTAGIDSASEVHHYHGEGHEDRLQLGSSDPIFKLPSEVSDLILSHLSPAALDAAAHTCRDWRRIILSNRWVLSSVLVAKEEWSPLDGSLGGKLSHRDLLKKLDCDSDLPSTSQHPDPWRTRHRTRYLEFSIPSPSSTLPRPIFAAAARTGTQNGFLAFQLQGSAQSTRNRLGNTLVIYRFDSADLPRYAGTVHDVEGQGELRISSAKEIRGHAEWLLKIEIGDTARLYSLIAREAFANSGSRFSLKALELRLPNIQELDRPPEPIQMGDQCWKILAHVPQNGEVCA